MGKTQSKGVVKTQVSVGTGKAPVKTTGGGKTAKGTIGRKTTVKVGNSFYDEGGRMPSTTGKPSGTGRGNNLPD